MADVEKVTGKIKWFDPRKGYGFVVDEHGQEFFTHISGVEKGRNYTGFEDGDEIEFVPDMTGDKRGPVATGVVLTKEELPPRKPRAKKETPAEEAAPAEADVTAKSE